MATLVFPMNLQKLEYNATTAEGPCRVTVVNGTMQVNLQASAPAAAGATERGSFKALLDPALTPGQFRSHTNEQTGAPAFGYPAKDQRELAAECRRL
jgi:hypothetical protein